MDIKKFIKSVWMSPKDNLFLVIEPSQFELRNVKYQGKQFQRVCFSKGDYFVDYQQEPDTNEGLHTHCKDLVDRIFMENPLVWILYCSENDISDLPKRYSVNKSTKDMMQQSFRDHVDIKKYWGSGICIQNKSVTQLGLSYIQLLFKQKRVAKLTNISIAKLHTMYKPMMIPIAKKLADSFKQQSVVNNKGAEDKAKSIYDFSELRQLCENFISEVDIDNHSVVIDSNNPILSYTYQSTIDHNSILFIKRTLIEKKEFLLDFNSNSLYVNNQKNNSSRSEFITHFKQIIEDISAEKVTIIGSAMR